VRLEEINQYGRDALRELLFHWPDEVQRETTNANLRTLRLLERDALVVVRTDVYDNSTWPPRPTRKSDKTWTVKLTGKGVQVALALGFETHPEDRCMVPSSCPLHTPFLENRIKAPTLNKEDDE
jgi:hypothetical protein